MVMSLLDRSHFGSVHHLARITMHSNARAAFSQIFRGLLQSSASLPSPTMKCANFGLSDLQQTTILLQNTDFNWIEIKVPGSTPEAPSRAPGPNGMVACACTTKSGGTFSFLCLLVDAVPVRAMQSESYFPIRHASFRLKLMMLRFIRQSALFHSPTLLLQPSEPQQSGTKTQAASALPQLRGVFWKAEEEAAALTNMRGGLSS